MDTDNVTNIRKYLMKKHDIKKPSKLFLKMLIELLASIVNASSQTKRVSLGNQKCEIRTYPH